MTGDGQRDRRRLGADTRGVSVAVTYALTLGITAILITGLLMSTATFFEQQQERSTRVQFRDIGGQFAHEIQYLDRLAAERDQRTTASLTVSLPGQVSNAPYSVEVREQDFDGDGEMEAMLYMTESRGTVTVTVPIDSETQLETGGVQTDEFEMRLCSGSPGDPEYGSDGQVIVFGGGCP